MKQTIILFFLFAAFGLNAQNFSAADSVGVVDLPDGLHQIRIYAQDGSDQGLAPMDTSTLIINAARIIYNAEKQGVVAARIDYQNNIVEELYEDIFPIMQRFTGVSYPRWLLNLSPLSSQLQSRYAGDYTITNGSATVYVRLEQPVGTALGVVNQIDQIGGSVLGSPTFGPGTWFCSSDEGLIINDFYNADPVNIPNNTRVSSLADEGSTYWIEGTDFVIIKSEQWSQN